MPITPETVLLTGRRVLVTGAAAGIGAEVAATCARFGADVAMCDRDEAGLQRVASEVSAAGREPLIGVLDVRDTDAVAEWVATIPAVDVLVNNAGGGFRSDFLDVNTKGQDSLVRENFTSVTNFVRACVPKMPADGHASIINITSIEAHRAAPGFAVYSAMKAAVAQLTQSLALELGARMIRVNCIAPDVIPTPGIGGDVPVKTPLPVPGRVDDVAAAVIYLASDLSRFVTGTTVHVDGGNRAAGGWGRAPDGSWVTAGEVTGP
jgi:NAD(P)-dependent dehydrogenase (short-subunit alcohol dehydrogenase family)